ncbi:hypothetical protein FVE85_4191 [Porphyridium purpureum]|uniref:Uncharacterized protein n=1 Tax=Porphyridium purpureum TaxID=35688 RepID=A0A5J4YSA8_PORPP|nr:hypothetical protein FVE85_4191 [Porphyridium purpureum]|eukprot:POR2048..scf229_5
MVIIIKLPQATLKPPADSVSCPVMERLPMKPFVARRWPPHAAIDSAAYAMTGAPGWQTCPCRSREVSRGPGVCSVDAQRGWHGSCKGTFVSRKTSDPSPHRHCGTARAKTIAPKLYSAARQCTSIHAKVKYIII